MSDTIYENEEIGYDIQNEVYIQRNKDVRPNRIIDSCIYIAWVKEPDIYTIGISHNKNSITYLLRNNEHFTQCKILYSVFIFESFLDNVLKDLKTWIIDNNMVYYNNSIDSTDCLLKISNIIEFQNLKSQMNSIGEVYYLKLKHNINKLNILQKKLEDKDNHIDRLERIIDMFLDKEDIIL